VQAKLELLEETSTELELGSTEEELLGAMLEELGSIEIEEELGVMEDEELLGFSLLELETIDEDELSVAGKLELLGLIVSSLLELIEISTTTPLTHC